MFCINDAIYSFLITYLLLDTINFARSAAADVSVATASAYLALGVSITDDAERDITVKAVSGKKKPDVVEATAPSVPSAAVAVASGMTAVAVASAAAVAVADVISVGKKG
jgi:hypothetical protein